MSPTQAMARVRHLGGTRYQAWLDAGYREYYQESYRVLHSTPYLLQKAFYDDAGTRLFFISVGVYDWSDYPQRESDAIAYQPDVQFNSHYDRTPGL